jgi:hypothetical protein
MGFLPPVGVVTNRQQMPESQRKTPCFFGVHFKDIRHWEGCGSLVDNNANMGGR